MSIRFEVVEEDCIGCGLCSERAPENLEIPAGDSTARVFKQPNTPEQDQACLEAADFCPIGGLHSRAVDSKATSIPARDPAITDITTPRWEIWK